VQRLLDACGNTGINRRQTLTPLTTSALSSEVLEVALNASRNPEQAPRVRMLLGDLLADIQDCESELGIYCAF